MCKLDSGHLISKPEGELHPADGSPRWPPGIRAPTGVRWHRGSVRTLQVQVSKLVGAVMEPTCAGQLNEWRALSLWSWGTLVSIA